MRLKWAIVLVALCVIVTVAAVAYAAGKSTVPEVIRAQRFEVVDGEGAVRGVLQILDGEVALSLDDSDGRPRIRLLVDGRGQPQLVLQDAKERMRAVARLYSHGSPEFALCDAAGRMRTHLALTRNDRPALELWDERGAPRASLGGAVVPHVTEHERNLRTRMEERPESSLVLLDLANQTRTGMLLENGKAGLALYGGWTTPRVELAVGSNIPPQLELSDAEGDVVWSAP